MQYLALLSLSALASASLLKRQVQCADPNSEACSDRQEMYLAEVCTPSNASGYPDFDAPCNAVQRITAACMYGAAGLGLLTGGTSDSTATGEEDPPELSNSTQRTCICESQFFDQTNGCEDCYKGHGFGQDGDVTGPDVFSSLSSQYCAVTYTPTVGIADFLDAYAATAQSTQSTAASNSTGFTLSDPIGNKTAVSYYFTPSVTGSAAYLVAEATDSASTSGSVSGSGSGSAMSTSMHTSNGQIVQTASVSEAGSASGSASGSAATASTTKSGAGKQEAAAVAGVIAFAGFVALL